jgi:hypothetical protein
MDRRGQNRKIDQQVEGRQKSRKVDRMGLNRQADRQAKGRQKSRKVDRMGQRGKGQANKHKNRQDGTE